MSMKLRSAGKADEVVVVAKAVGVKPTKFPRDVQKVITLLAKNYNMLTAKINKFEKDYANLNGNTTYNNLLARRGDIKEELFRIFDEYRASNRSRSNSGSSSSGSNSSSGSSSSSSSSGCV
jgi:uncharacterized membrane protein YgcG